MGIRYISAAVFLTLSSLSTPAEAGKKGFCAGLGRRIPLLKDYFDHKRELALTATTKHIESNALQVEKWSSLLLPPENPQLQSSWERGKHSLAEQVKQRNQQIELFFEQEDPGYKKSGKFPSVSKDRQRDLAEYLYASQSLFAFRFFQQELHLQMEQWGYQKKWPETADVRPLLHKLHNKFIRPLTDEQLAMLISAVRQDELAVRRVLKTVEDHLTARVRRRESVLFPK